MPRIKLLFKTQATYWLILLTLIAYAVRVIGAQSSIAYITNTQIVREAFELGQRLTSLQLYDIGLGGDFKYPLTLPLYLLGVYGMYFLTQLISGSVSSTADFATLALAHRLQMHWIAVLALNVINVLIVPALYFMSRKIDERHTGWIAALLAAFNLLMVQFSHHARPHAPMAAISTLAIIGLIAVGQGVKPKWCYVSTILTALTIGTLQNGFVLLGPFALAWIIRAYDRDEKRLLWSRLFSWTTLLNTALLIGLVLMLYPHFILDYSGMMLTFITGRERVVMAGGQHHFDMSWFKVSALHTNWWRLYYYQPLITRLGLVGLVYLIWKLRQRVDVLIIGLVFPLVNLIAFGFFENSFPRILMTLTPGMILVSAVLLEDAALLITRFAKLPHWLTAGATAMIVAAPLAWNAMRLTRITGQADTRTLAAQWIEANIPDSAGILTNFTSYDLTPTAASLEQQQVDYPDSLGTEDQWLLSLPAEEYPDAPHYDLLSTDLYYLSDAAAYRDLAEHRDLGYAMLVVRNLVELDSDTALMQYLKEEASLIHVVCPGIGVQWNYLPDDIEGMAVWHVLDRYERGGPIMLIFELGEPAPLPDHASICEASG